ncbi:hypothetical protein Ocin01_18535, partial [Orchesella cincta]
SHPCRLLKLQVTRSRYFEKVWEKMKFLLLFLALAEHTLLKVSFLKCWECQSELGPQPFECDKRNTGRSVDCPNPRAGLEPVCVAWIWTEERESAGPPIIFLKKFCSWVAASKIGGATENCNTHPEDSEKKVCWCKSKDNCNQDGILDQGKVGKWECKDLGTGAKSVSTPPTLLALLTIGIIILRIANFVFSSLCCCSVCWLQVVSYWPLQCKTGHGADSHSTICNGTNPFCYIRMKEEGYARDSSLYYGCLEEKEFTRSSVIRGSTEIALWITRRATLTSGAIVMTRMTATRRPSTRWGEVGHVDWIYFVGMYPVACY